jgi:hypothetical protein
MRSTAPLINLANSPDWRLAERPVISKPSHVRRETVFSRPMFASCSKAIFAKSLKYLVGEHGLEPWTR